MNVIKIRSLLLSPLKIKPHFTVAAAAVCMMFGSHAVRAQTINFDIPGGVGAVNYSGPGAAPDPGLYWNAIAYQSTSSGGLLSDGATTSPVTLTDTSPNYYNPGQESQGTPGGLEAPYAYENNGTPATESLNNVPAGTYNLYLYGKNYPYSNRGTTFSVSVGSTSYGSQSTVGSSTTSFTLGNDYVVFSNVVVTAGETITFTYAANTAVSGNGEGDFNGLQLVNQAGASDSGPSPGPGVTAVWTGSANANWDIGTSANWLTNGVAGVYSQGNVAQFNDSSSVNAINLTAALTPSSVLVNNSVANYTFAGNGALGGTSAFSLTKLGTAMLTISNANTFAGSVYVGGGILQVGNSSALGNGSGTTVVSNGATLDLNGFNIGNQPVVIQGTGSSGQGAINNTGGAVYPAISQVTLTGDAALGSAGGTWEIKPQSSGGTATLSTGGNPYNLDIVGNGFIGLYGVTVDPALHNIDVQGGTFDLENTTSGSLGDSTGTLTLENNTTLIFYQILNPISKPTVFNAAALSNNNGPTTFTGPVAFNGYVVFGLYTSLSFDGTITGTGPLEVQAGPGSLSLNGTNDYTGDIYMDSGVGALSLNGPGAAATGSISIEQNDSITINGSYGGSISDNGSTGTSLFGNGTNYGFVNFNGLISPGQLNLAGTLTVGGLTLGSGAVLDMDLGSTVTGSNDLLQVNGDLNLNGNNVAINFLQDHLQVGTYRLINYTGTLSGNFGTLATRAQATIDTSTPGQVNLIVTGGGTAANLIWNTNNNTGVWDTDVSTNWLNTGTGSADYFFSGDNVLFNDWVGVPTTVTINGTVLPDSITVNSSTNNFTFSGSGTISGSASLTKSGTSTLTLSTLGNFTGPVMITGGTVSTPGGTLASVASITITNNSTFDVAGSSLAGPKPITVSGVGSNGKGAIFNSVGDYPNLVLAIALAGDTRFGGSARWDLASGSAITGPYNLTVDWSGGGGYGQWNTMTIGATVPEIFVTNGIVPANTTALGMTGMDTSCQNPSTLFDISTNCQLTFYSGGFNGSILDGGVVSIDSANITFSGNSIHILSGGVIYAEDPGITFNGSNLIFENDSSLQTYYNAGTNDINNAVTFNGVAHLVIGDHSVVYTNLLSGPGGFVLDYYNHNMILSASNTYSGPTVIGSSGNTPEVALIGNGSISHSSPIFFGGNSPTVAHIDVSGRSDETLTLADGQTLAGIGGINGSLVVSTGAIISPAGTNTTIGITTGSNSVGELTASDNITLDGATIIKLNGLTNDVISAAAGLTYGGTLNLVNISVTPLAAGNTFQVFNAVTYSGSFAGITPATPGAGLVWDTSHLNSGIIGVIAPGSTGPVIGGTRLSGGNLILSGTGGTANGTYYVLTTTNLTTPLADWVPLVTNTYDASGDFAFTNAVNPGLPQQFYLIKQP
jgi:autotransporter-associated beta strand protein